MAKPPMSVLKIFDIDAESMARRSRRLPPGWWIVDTASNTFFDGPYETKEAALERYNRLPPHLRSPSPFTL